MGRYPVYLEAGSYPWSLKHKLACGSALVSPAMRLHDWWSRALKPGRHYVQISSGDDMCRDAVAKVGPQDWTVAIRFIHVASALLMASMVMLQQSTMTRPFSCNHRW